MFQYIKIHQSNKLKMKKWFKKIHIHVHNYYLSSYDTKSRYSFETLALSTRRVVFIVQVNSFQCLSFVGRVQMHT